MRLERFKIQKFSNPGKGDTPFPGPYPPQPLPFGPRRILAPLWQKASCALPAEQAKTVKRVPGA